MNGALLTEPLSVFPANVRDFAAARGVSQHLPAVLDLARQAFPTSAMAVSFGQDAEDDAHQSSPSTSRLAVAQAKSCWRGSGSGPWSWRTSVRRALASTSCWGGDELARLLVRCGPAVRSHR